MIRALFSCLPGTGHVQPLLPLARALRDRGNEVAFASGHDVRTELVRDRFEFHCVGPTAFALGLEAGRRNLDLSPRGQRMTMLRFGFTELRLATALPQMVDVVRQWQPDILVHDVAEYAAAPAATAAGLPHVTVGYGPRLGSDLIDAVRVGVTPHWQRLGLDDPKAGGLYDHCYFDPVPDALQDPGLERAPTVRPMQPSLGPETSVESPDIGTVRNRPLIYLTFGTFYGMVGLAPFRAILDVLERMDVDAIVTTGNVPLGELGKRRANVVLKDFIPQRAILDHADLTITHGGAGPVFASLSYGVPLVVLPQGADHFDNARAVERGAVGRCLVDEDQLGTGLGEAIAETVGSDGYRERARSVGRQIATMPDADACATVVERLARSGAKP